MSAICNKCEKDHCLGYSEHEVAPYDTPSGSCECGQIAIATVDAQQ